MIESDDQNRGERVVREGPTSGERPQVTPGQPDELAHLPDVSAVEALVRRAIDTRRVDLLDVVGHGEFSVAVRWPVDGGFVVVKRVPPFLTAAAAAEYRAITREYIDALEAVGVACVRTDLVQLDRDDGSSVVFHCQPLLAPEQLVSNILRADEPDPDHPVVAAVVDATVRATMPNLAFDGQCSNWGWVDGRVWHLDFSTPMLLDDDGRLRFDQDGFGREYPALVRRIFDREARKLVLSYTDPAFVLTDLVSLLHREHLEQWCEAFISVIRRDHGIEVSAAQAAKNHRIDRRVYPFMHALRKVQRSWLQRTGRRYESLLPTRSSYSG
jgi:hypothetical protein